MGRATLETQAALAEYLDGEIVVTEGDSDGNERSDFSFDGANHDGAAAFIRMMSKMGYRTDSEIIVRVFTDGTAAPAEDAQDGYVLRG